MPTSITLYLFVLTWVTGTLSYAYLGYGYLCYASFDKV